MAVRSRVSRVLLQSAERGAFAYVHLLSATSFLSGLTFLATTNTITAGWPFAVLALFVITAAVLTIPITVVEIVRARNRSGEPEATAPVDGSHAVAGQGLMNTHAESPSSNDATS